MVFITEVRKQEIKKIVDPLINKSLASIARENNIIFIETDLHSVDKTAGGLIMYLKDSDSFGILIEKTDPGVRKRFSFAHELGHYFLHKEYLLKEHGALIDNDNTFGLFRAEVDPKNINMRTFEAEANYFASELLMPEYMVKEAVDKFGRNITELASFFYVSEQAMTYRLLSLSLLNK